MTRQTVLVLALAMATCWRTGAQTGGPVQLLDWVEARESGGTVAWLKARLGELNDFFVRITSPDVPRASRHLWRVDIAGKDSCMLSTDEGVRFPRWNQSGGVLYLMEADTNHDGKIDFRDDFLIRVLSSSTGPPRTVGQGQTAVWSPDGRYIALVRDGNVMVTDLQGNVIPPGSASPAGKLIAASSRNAAVAPNFWAIDAQTAKREELPEELRRKYLWLGALSPSGSMVVFPNTSRAALVVQQTGPAGTRRELIGGEFHFLDPTWAPDEKQIVYVSDRPSGPTCTTP